MASLSADKLKSKHKGGRPKVSYRVMLYIDGVRKAVRLGQISKRDAETALVEIEALVSCRITGSVAPERTARWLADQSDEIRDRLARIGLAESSATGRNTTIGELIVAYRDQKYPQLKPGSIHVMECAFRSMTTYWGRDRLVADVNPGDAEKLQDAMLKEGLSEATTRKRCSNASKMMRYAIRQGIIEKNPFDDSGVKRGNLATTRFKLVSRENAEKVLEQLPEPQWKLLFALSRWGGLRIGSEPRRLKWGDIDFDRRRITVTASKAEHHADGGMRVIPIFPEIAPLLDDCYHQAEEGEELVLPFLKGRTDASLRKTVLRAIKLAEVEPWQRLWHNLRAVRQIELSREFGPKVACDWIGNSQEVAMKHYDRTTEDDFAKAIDSGTVLKPTHARRDTKGNEESEKSSVQPETPVIPVVPVISANSSVGDTGLEPVTSAV